MKTILYYTKSNYGTEVAYVATHESNEQAEMALAIRLLTGRTTLTRSDMAQLSRLGFSFVQVLPPTNGVRGSFAAFAGGQ